MSDDWYYAEDDHHVGPLSLQQLIEALQPMQRWDDALVWRDGFPDWKRAGDLPELKSTHAGPPPLPAKQKQTPGWHAIIAIIFLGSVASRAGMNELGKVCAERREMRRRAKLAGSGS
jgi:hypothetical protein